MLYSHHKLLLGLAGKWAGPGGTAMPGQPVTEPEQAPELYPLLKISLISKGGHGCIHCLQGWMILKDKRQVSWTY